MRATGTSNLCEGVQRFAKRCETAGPGSRRRRLGPFFASGSPVLVSSRSAFGLLSAVVLGAALVGGCGSSSEKRTAPPLDGDAGSAGASGSGTGAGAGAGTGGKAAGGTGGSTGGSAGASGSAGGAGGSTGGSAGKAGTGGVGGSAGGAAGSGGMQGPPPQLEGCPKDVVLGASKMTLSMPTPMPAMTALAGPLAPNTPLFAAAVKNIDKASLNNDVSMTTLAFSGVNPGGGVAKFIPGKVPAPVLATFADQGIQSPPISGVFVRFLDEAGAEVLMPITNARLSIVPDKGCKSGKGALDATVEAADLKTINVKLGGKMQPLSDVFGPLTMGGQGMASGWQLRLDFDLTEIQFDLTTVP